MSAAGEAQLAKLTADRHAQAEIDRTNRAAYAEAQTRRAAAARDARDDVRRAHLHVEDANDAFARTAVAHRLQTATANQLSAAWRALDTARTRLAAARAVAEDMAG